MGEIEKCKDNRSDLKDHLNTIAEGAGKRFPAQIPAYTVLLVAPRHTHQLPCPGCSWWLAPASRHLFPISTKRYMSCCISAPFAFDVPLIQVGSAQVWGNKILQKYRNDAGEDSKHHVAFVKGYTALLQGLAAYAKANHATGLTWKANGGDALAAFSTGSSSAPVAAPVSSGPPPPGPPPPGPPPGFWKDDKAAAPAAPKTGYCAVNC